MRHTADLDEAAGSSAVQWLLTGVAILIAVASGIGFMHMLEEPAAPAQRVVLAQPHERVAPVLPLPAVAQPAAVAGPAQAPAAAACPMQQLSLTLPGASALAVCFAATHIRQTGNVRSYIVQGSGSEQWLLQIDVAGGAVMDAVLSSRDGARFNCAALGCAGIRLSRHDARGVRHLGLAALQLAAAGTAGDAKSAARAFVSGRLEAPADAQVPGLACTGPSVQIAAPDGGTQAFCGQGGAGVEFADDGLRYYRFQDLEGQTMTIAVDSQKRIGRVEYGSFNCSGTACSGASMVADGAPPTDLSGRSFFFGRTPLFSGSSASRPGLVLDGSLVMPAQE